jgi:uncharacterized surface protein with fasciclin (FAS1) repeats
MRAIRAALLCGALAGCGSTAPSTPARTVVAPSRAAVVAPPKVTPPPAPKAESERTVLDVALSSPDHTTLVAAVKAAGKADALASPGGVYTVFAPTDAAFAALPAGTVESLLTPEKKADLTAIVQHHAAVPILNQRDMTDGRTLGMADGTSVTFHVQGDKVMVDDATIVAAVPAMNGIVYVIDKVLLPKAK